MTMLGRSVDPKDVPPFRGAEKTWVLAILLGEAFAALMFVRWVFHLSWAVYLFLIPWGALGGFTVMQRARVVRWSRRFEAMLQRDMERLDKWTPPGFP